MTQNNSTAERGKGFRFLSGNMIKIIAAILMVIDHVGVVLGLEGGIIRILGRISMPLFAFMIAEGARYTKNKGKYLGLIAGLATVCQLVYFFVLHDTYMCILVTFSISIILIYALNSMKRAYLSEDSTTTMKIISPLVFFGLCIGTYFLNKAFAIDYGFFGIMMPLFASITDFRGYKIPEKFSFLDDRWVRILMMCIPMLVRMINYPSIMWYSFLAIPILLLYSGERGKWKMKYFFYIFYPLHLALIYGVLILIMLLR